MKNIKFIFIFVLGVVAGGLFFGLQGPAPSQAASKLPRDLFYLQMSYTDKQRFCINQTKYPDYKVARVGYTGTECIVGYIEKD